MFCIVYSYTLCCNGYLVLSELISTMQVEHFNEELTGKADKKDVKELKRKKANLSDLQTLRDQVSYKAA